MIDDRYFVFAFLMTISVAGFGGQRFLYNGEGLGYVDFLRAFIC